MYVIEVEFTKADIKAMEDRVNKLMQRGIRIGNLKSLFEHYTNTRESLKNEIVSKYGIVKERVAALMTDALRANLLECVGYKTQLLEFIDIAHSPKNILIRASKSNISENRKEKSLKE